MKVLGWVLAALIAVGIMNGTDDSESQDNSPSGYNGSYRNDVNGNPVPNDCAGWASSSDNPLGDDPYGQELCEAWD